MVSEGKWLERGVWLERTALYPEGGRREAGLAQQDSPLWSGSSLDHSMMDSTAPPLPWVGSQEPRTWLVMPLPTVDGRPAFAPFWEDVNPLAKVAS